MSAQRPTTCIAFSTLLAGMLACASPGFAQDEGKTGPGGAKPAGISVQLAPLDGEEASATGASAEQDDRNERFARYLTGAKFTGRFTVLGSEKDEMPPEEYTITKCEKLPESNLFRFTARIKYGDTDTEVPMDLPVVWAGDTPVISLTNLWLPGLGTFSSRVVVYQGSYAGTWKHGDKGGHLFGTVESISADAAAGETPAAEEPASRISKDLPAKPVTISNSGK